VNKIGEPHGIVYKNDLQYAIYNPYLVSVVIIGSAIVASFDITIHYTTYIFLKQHLFFFLAPIIFPTCSSFGLGID